MATPLSAANDRIGIGFIGCGNMGSIDQRDFQLNPDVEVVAVCDVYRPNAERAQKTAGGSAKIYSDYRRLLENKDVQAVVIATPEHWHALMAIDACDAGKDVYVEKPASHHIRDGRLMVEAARRNNRVVQVGSQQRSGLHFQRVVKYIREGKIGDVAYTVCWNHSGLGADAPPAAAQPPADLDWDMWLGPAPKLPYRDVWGTLRRTSWDFWGGMITEWGCHLMDIALWGLEAKTPISVVAQGGHVRLKNSEIPETLQVLYEYPNFLIQYSVLRHNSFGPNGDPGAARFGSFGIQFHGTKGTIFVDRAGFRLTPQPLRHEEPGNPPRTVGNPDERQPGFYYTADVPPEVSDSSSQHPPHVRNFLDCVQSRRRPVADIEEGHITNTVCRLGNIAYRVGRKIRWDAEKEQVIGDAEANRMVVGTYRAPWIPKGL
jgi:predicted dehydrogenase